jgi:hypothetical protein
VQQRWAMLDLRQLDDPYRSEMNIIALDRDGRPAAASSTPGKTFIYKTTDMERFAEDQRQVIPYEA